MILNQQVTEEQYKTFRADLFKIIENWRPFTTTYLQLRNAGWHREFNDENEYVSEFMSDEKPYIRQYHDAWSKLDKTKQMEIVKLIKDTDYLETEPALQTFTQITGIEADSRPETIEFDGKKYDKEEFEKRLKELEPIE